MLCVCVCWGGEHQEVAVLYSALDHLVVHQRLNLPATTSQLLLFFCWTSLRGLSGCLMTPNRRQKRADCGPSGAQWTGGGLQWADLRLDVAHDRLAVASPLVGDHTCGVGGALLINL